jgi:predicted Zn-dependent protease
MTVPAKGRAEAVRLFKKNGNEEASRQEMTFAVDYLLFFGYVGVELIKHVSYEDLKKGVQSFQRMFGLKADGVIDHKTIRAMECPRCGCPDHIDAGNKQHVQFLRAQEVAADRRDRWNKQGLTYYISQYVGNGVSRKTQKQVVADAFKAWDEVCGLDITEAKSLNRADIVIETGQGPQHNFDGRGGTLAWAYMPTGNDRQLTMKFDLDETWVTEPQQRGIQLFNVACHEFGHLLGLSHSKKPSALMAPYYNPFIATPQADDDIPRVQKLYGPGPAPAPIRGLKPAGDELTVELKPGQRLVVSCKS